MTSKFQVAGQGYAIERCYSVPDDAWYLELAGTDPVGRTFPADGWTGGAAR
jgi:hypothetical protein